MHGELISALGGFHSLIEFRLSAGFDSNVLHSNSRDCDVEAIIDAVLTGHTL
jgi:hypothetical protein